MTLACFPEMFHLWMDRALEFIQTCIDVGKKSTIPPGQVVRGSGRFRPKRPMIHRCSREER